MFELKLSHISEVINFHFIRPLTILIVFLYHSHVLFKDIESENLLLGIILSAIRSLEHLELILKLFSIFLRMA
jgi:hypothetical protein